MINLIRNTINSFRAVFGNAAANAFIQATGITGSVQKAAITQLCIDLQASGLWSKMKAVYPMVTDNYNLLSYTEDFSNAFWQQTNATVTTNTTTAPNGTLTADTISFGSAGFIIYTTTLNGNYTYSVYLKYKGSQWACVENYNVSDKAAWFDLQNGVVGTTMNGATSSITSVGNGWYRCSVTMNAVNTNTSVFAFFTTTANGVFTKNGDLYAWGAQLELGNTLSAYQPILTTPSAFMASQMKYNLKDARDLDAAFRLTWSGGWTYSATGATPNGTNAYANTNLIENNTLTLNSAHISIYSRTNATGLYTDIGVGGAVETNIFSNYNNTFYPRVQAGNSGVPISYNTAALFIANRVNSTEVQGWRNNVKNVITNAVNSMTTSNMYISAANNGGTPIFFSPRQLAFVTIGYGLTDTETLVFNQIVEKYQVALSRGVQAAQSFYYNSAYSNEANTYLYSTQITGTTQVSAINTLINGLKANNLWSKMKAVYPFVTDKTLQSDMAAQMKFNLVNPQDSDAAFRLAFSGGWTYSTNGAQPNGTNGYADTKFIPSANLSATSQSSSIYSRTNANGAGVCSDLSSVSAGGNFSLTAGLNFSGINAYVRYGSITDVRNTSSQRYDGYFVGSRTANNILKLWRSNVQLVSTQTTVETGISTLSPTIGAENWNSGPIYFSNKQYAFVHIGDGLTDTEASLLYQLVQDFQTTLSRQV